ncbi:polyketide synthase [Streptomyces sp. PT12]|nr:polyketide synthase [Streptomyces sp. PT12]
MTIGTLRRDEGGVRRLLLSLGEAYAHGVPVRWGLEGGHVDLPTYPFQRQRYWLDVEPALDTEFWQAIDNGELALDDDALRALTSWREARRNASVADSWRYRITWKPVATAPSELTGTWLVVTAPGVDNPLPGALTLELDPADADRAVLAARLTEAADGHALTGVLSLAGADERPLPGHRSLTHGLAHTVALVQALGDAGFTTPLWVATRGAVSVDGERPASPTQAQLWGLGRVAAQEQPELWGGLVDLPETLDERALARLATAISGGLGDEDQVAIRLDGVYARRFTRAAARRTRDWAPSGTVLVTGGTGAVGSRIGRWLAENGASHVVLTSRRGENAPGATELADDIRALGAEATIAACDAADRDALAALLAGLTDLTAVIHAAVVLDDGVFDVMDPARLDRVLAPKAEAARHLDELTRDRDLDAFVLFSSAAGTLGNGGQANYAAANAHLDALAEQRRADGLTATSVAWGPWGGGGPADGAVGERLEQQGVPAMNPDLAISALRQAIEADDTFVAVADIRWETFYPSFAAARRSALLSDLAEIRSLPEPTSLEARLAGLTEAERARVLLDLVRGQAAAVLGYASVDAVEPGRPFRDLGFDSLTAVEIRNRLSSATGLRLPATLVFDYPTPTALAGYLRELIGGSADPATDAADAAAAPAVADDDPIAIVSLGCRFPGGIEAPEQLWDLLVSGRDAVGGFPDDRGWDLDALYDADPDAAGTTYTREGGFLRGATEFDSEFFGISPREALAIDPQQRLLLEVCWEAIERAGIDPSTLRGSRSGVFIGNTGETYSGLLERNPGDAEGYLLTGNTSSVLSGRVAYTLGLEGPAMTVDTACSSSLLALHLAAQSLRQGECTLALAGGVTILSGPAGLVEFSRQRGLAEDGRCKAFDADADGTGFAEGVGIVVVERLSDARRNGHPVLALLRGSAVNQDGASNGLTAPNGPAQQRVIRAALANAGLTTSDIDAVEAHGTGTRLGDPIEAQALLATYGRDRDRERPLWLGALKSNIGHTLAASGIAGVMKMVLSLTHGLLPRTLHVNEPTPHVDWSAGAVELLTEARPWEPDDRPRRAGVSSFGISGTNAHAIIEEAPAAEPPAPRGPLPLPVLPVVLSARDDAALREQARQLRELDHEPLDLAYSLATGRAALEHRAVVVAGPGQDIAEGLDAIATGAESPAVVRGTVRATGPLAFLFTGQGSQRLGMGRELYEAFSVYAEAFDAACERFELPVREVVFGDDAEALDRTEYAQAALFAVEVALFRLVASWGITPDFLAGHSIGEIAAAHVAGVLSLDDACTLVAARGRLMGALPEGGAMVAVQAPESEVAALLTDGVDIAAVNGPDSVVLSGDEQAVVELAQRWKHKRLTTSHAFHSHRMDPMLDDFRTVAETLTYNRALIPIAGQPATTDAAYWVRHVRDAVRFHDATEWLAAQGATTALEIGPDGVLSALADGIPALRRDRPETETLIGALATLHTRGVTPDWAALFHGTGARRVDLPTYPFQRRRYWPAAPVDDQPLTGDVIEARFWEAVDREDLEALAETLDTTDEQLSGVLPALSSWRRKRRTESVLDSWRYRVTWKPATGVTSPVLTGTWLLVGAQHPDVEEALARCGATVTRVDSPEAIVSAALPTPLSGVLSLLALDPDPLPGGSYVPHPVAATAALVRALGAAGIDAPLWVATRGAVAATRAERATDADQAAVWGLGQVIGLEQPQRWGGLIDLPTDLDSRAATRLGGVLSGTSGEDQVAIRPSGVFLRRLSRAPIGDAAPAQDWRPTGTTLVTGGTGALGAHTARWLAAHGAEHLLLTSRRGLAAPGAAELRDELTALGTRVTVVTCDVADRDALAALLEIHPVDAVFHTAGVLDDGVLDALTTDRFATVFRAKVRSALHLDELTRDRDLSAFVLFSSLAGMMGNAGQGNYAAANAYLDALAERRRAEGLPATSVAWGAWDGGMADGRAAAERVRRGGVPLMAPDLAIAALKQALDHQDTVVAIAAMDWAKTLPEFSAARPNPLVAGLAPADPAPQGPNATQVPNAAPATAEPDRAGALTEQELLHLVRTQVALVLAHGGPESIDPERAFNDLGFDSLTAVELRNRLGAATGRTLPATLVFDHPTPKALAAFLRDTATPHAQATPGTTTATDDDPIAIVGMACRFPGGVASPDDLWRLLLDGTDTTSGFPENRGWDELASVTTREGAFLHDADQFDPAFFGISPREAVAMDPQQRLLLETAWEAFERTGIDPAALRGSATGVFVGTNGQDYVTLLQRSTDDVGGFLGTGNAAAVVSGRLAYTFGLEGPAVTVDTACSSSLVALHWAAQALRQGECSLALAGGVTVMSSPVAFVEFSKQGGLAADGRCKAFAADADGTAWGEGVGLLVVERLSEARRNGHPVLAVLRGSAVNSDGASNGLTAPNGPSQQRVIRAALDSAGLTPADVGAVEAHGTGTTLGDPIEAQALLATYGQDRELPLWLGSVKSNIGHTQAAAGVAGVIKMVMAVHHGVLPPTLHVDQPSPHVDWSTGAVELLTETREWDTRGPRRAGVSSFGMSGTNAHAIIEQAPDEPMPELTGTPAEFTLPLLPVPVSARSRDALRAQAARLADSGHAPLDVAYSAATTRSALDHRAVVLATDAATLRHGLATVLDGGAIVGQATSTRRLALVFSGQGSQRPGMGRELYDAFPVFADAFDAVCARLDAHLELPVREVVFGDDAEILNRTEFAQAGLFAVEVALFRLVESWGIRPDFLAGHSIGEIAAAHVAGVLSLDDACALVAARGRLMGALPEGGAMVAVQASESEVLPLLTGGVDIAAVNGPDSVVLSGDEQAVVALAGRWKHKRLTVSHAFHSHLMDPMLDAFRAVAETLTYHPAGLPIAGQPESVDAEYWVRHVREAVRFHDATEQLRADGVDTFLEIGPDGVLSALTDGIPALRKNRPDTEALLTALATLHVHGIDVDWEAFYAGTGARRVALPTYAFQRQRYWPELAPIGDDAAFWEAAESGDLADILEPVLPALHDWRERRRHTSATDAWRYRIDWTPLAETPAPALTGRWLVLRPEHHTELADTIVEGLRARGADLTTDPAAPGGDLTGVLSLLALDTTPLGSGITAGLVATAAALRDAADAPLWCVTREAATAENADPAQAAVWGLGRVAALEQPQRWGGLIDLPAEIGEPEIDRLAAALGRADGEDQIAIRPGGTWARRMVRAKSTETGTRWTPTGTVLITGGTGALGAHTARWLAGSGAEHVVLTSRRGENAPGAPELADELRASGARVTIAACDVADREALAALLGELPDLTAVFHTAGVLDDGLVEALTPERFETVFHAKVRSALNLHQLTEDRDLAAFVLFSSTAGVFGSSGQGNYAAANAYLDALAQLRREAGLPATSVAFGPWAQGGMAEAVGAKLRRGGVRAMAPELAMTALRRALDLDDTAVAVVDIDWERFAAEFAATRPARLFDAVPEAAAATAPADATARRFATMNAAERERALLDLVRAQVALVLGHDGSGAIAPDRVFSDLGFDSLTAVELRNALAAATELRLPTTLVFDHPTPGALAAHLNAELVGETAVATTAGPGPFTDEPIAIVAMSCRFPGGVSSPEELWQLLASGADAVGPLPEDRGWNVTFDAEGGREGTIATRAGAFLDAVGDFDADFFGISPREALALDPQQRLLLETTWEVFERAGIDPAALRGSATGVFIGSNGQDYGAVLMNAKESTEGYAGTGTAASVISGRLAYTFALEGPAVTVDTACSSSLVALHLAAQALRQGECSMALAGGVTVMTSPAAFIEFSRQRGLAEDGRCKAFGADADGTGWGEGVGMLIVERLSDARRNGHPVLAVVHGSAVNQDGASNGLTAPNGPSQRRVIRAALDSAGLTPADVDAVEAHGTGTRLGDPIEAQALLATYGQDRQRPLWLGSIKSNIGHTQAAAGVAGIIKMVMAMRHGVLPKTLHADEPTPHVDWSAGAVELLSESRAWASEGPRRAGVSSFGMSGTNAHVILGEAPAHPAEPAPVERPAPPPFVPLPLSAASPRALAAQAAGLLHTLDADLGDLAHSLATTRSTLSHRAVVLARDTEGAREGLAALAEGRGGPLTGEATDGRLAFLFSGQGSQRLGMGRELYEAFPVYAEAFDAACERFELPVWEVVFGDDAEALNRTEYAQAALFAVEVALFRLVASWGITPDFLAGHSIGEIAAAHVAGVLSLDDACTLVAARGRLMGALPEGGAMVAVQAPESEVLPLLVDGVDLAAVNGPDSAVLSGDEDAVLALAARWKHKRLTVSHAFHSHLMDPMLEDFRTVAESLTYHPARLPIAGQPERVDADYWVRHVREAVRFHDAVEALRGRGATSFLEIGPDGVLSAMAEGVPALRRDRPEPEALLTAVARLHVTGTPVDWASLTPGARRVELPTYPFQRTRYWPEHTGAATDDDSRFWNAVDNGELALDDTALTAVNAWREKQRHEAAHEAWRYRVEWKPFTGNSAALHGTWLVIVPTTPHPWTTPVLETLPGARAVTADRIGELTEGPAVTGVLSLLALGRHHDPRHASLATAAALRALDDAGVNAPVWIATSGAVATGRADRVTAPDATAVWGLGRVIGLELPDRWGGLIDLPEQPDERAAARLATALGATGEDQLAVRASGVFVRRLAHQPLTRVTRPWTPRGTVLVTGGTGALGRRVARWLAEAGAGHLVLASRSGGDAEALSAELGTRVTVARCDIADRDAVAALVEGLPELTAVVHAAGAADTRPLAESDTAALAGTMAAKVLGAAHLDELLGERELDAFVLFSSIAGVWGSGGQGAYAAANAYLDGLAEQRRARGLRATSIAWGPWAEAGMAATDEAEDLLRRRGLPALAPDTAVAALRRALDEDQTCLTVADVDWARFAPSFAAARPRPLIADLPEVRELGDTDGAMDGTAPQLARALAPLASAERTRRLIELVRTEAAAVLGHRSTEAVTATRPLRELGFDSLTAVELRQRLQAATGLTLPTTLVFDHPTAEALATLLGTQLLGDEPESTSLATASHTATGAAQADDPIVIVGMSCRFPGGVRSPEDLWRLTAEGTDAITGFPADRGWDLATLYDAGADAAGSSVTAEGGFLHDAAEFDAAFFGINPREALAMDPQQRLLLEASWEALESAGIDPTSLRGSQTGVFVGASPSGYGVAPADAPDGTEGYFLTGSATAVASGRVSYTLGLEGPAVTVDTACSSSLVALHYAAQSLARGECSLALVGGVSVMASPAVFTEFSRQRGLAEDGRCKSFSDHADGTGWGEGVGILLIQRLSDARRDGHRVLAVVRGSAVNSDGASNGLTAPNGPAQQRVIRAALADAGLTTSDIDAVEAHGTGTTLGDPIEAQALLATYGQDRDDRRPLWLGSIKSNIGHTQAAAGVAGIIKMVMAMRHATLPKTLHADEPTTHVDWSAGAVKLLTEARPWTAEGPRRAAVSAFGVSGTNAHTVLEQAPDAEELTPSPEQTPLPAVPLLVSGHGDAALRAQAARLRAHLAATDGWNLNDIAYSAAATRTAHDHRAAVIAADRDQLLRGLEAIATGHTRAGVITGTARREGRTAFLFTGQGSQRLGMGRELSEAFPVFAEAFDACCAHLDTALDRPLAEVIAADPDALTTTVYAQAGLFAFEVALFRLLESLGVHPDFVAGHSIGEIAAAHVAGVMSLEDACTLVAARGRLMQALPPGGAMVAVQAPESEVLPLLVDGVDLAAVNGPDAVVLSGDEDAVLSLAPLWKHKRLTVSHAFHSRHMEPMLDRFRAVAETLTYHPARIPVAGAPETVDATHWVRHVRDTVRFHDTVEELTQAGVTMFAELGPDAALSATGGFLPLQRRDRPEVETLLTGLATLHVGGVPVDWRPLTPGRTATLPTYAFQRERFWLTPTAPAAGAGARPEDTGFWETVERGDLAALAATLDIAPDAPLATVLPALSTWHRKRDEHATADSWRYHVTWKPLGDTTAPALAGTWLVIGEGEAAEAAAEALTGRGADVVTVEPGGTDREALALRLGKEAEGITALTGVLSLLALDATPHPAGSVGFAENVTLAQALGDTGVDAPLWLVTSGAVTTGPTDRAVRPDQALTWGFGRVVGLEAPTRFGGLADLPAIPDRRAWERLVAAIAGREDEVAIRAGGTFARRLAHAPGDEPRGHWTPRGTVLVTGGTGALGSRVARWLLDTGADHVVLTSRRGIDAPGARALADDLGPRATVTACDIADRDAVAALVEGLPELTAVVHAAGAADTRPLAESDTAALAGIIAAKVLGAAHLHELLGERELDAFVLFSSIAGVWGSGGQGAYAAANAYLDALAEQRRARGLSATSIAWGPWAEGGMADAGAHELRRRGLPALDPHLAVIALGRALDRGDTTVTVADVDWDLFAPAYTAARPRPLLDDVAPPTPATAEPAADADDLRARLAALTEADRVGTLLDLVRGEAAAALGHDSADRVEPTRGFMELGFDSLTAVELRNRLGAATGLRLPTTLVFDHPSPTALARHLTTELTPGTTQDSGTGDGRDIDRLAAAMAAATEDERAETVAQLRSLINRWTGQNATDRSIADATADEIFDIIHEEFGKTQ